MGSTRELTTEEQEIYDELASCLDPIPRHLLRPLRVYAILSEQWERAASNLDGSGGLHQYKLAQMLSYFGSQAKRAKATIDKEIERQRLAREKAAEDRIDEELFVDL